ncbi:prefoldin subunit family protein [Cryptosporidium andersoni]|uniref:Prefoldin subunit family protein n=1 Tax=Cryptosporidium andersoni TaxID=117008 RepID=A0A1J4MSD3_9CRYT|nr:prefoldin subunit family protein [Cryptosporidium andersoni]
MDSNETSLEEKKSNLENEIKGLNEIILEFQEVSKVIEHLPEKNQHEVMVPLGPLAFSPGYITNTNQVLMLLGSDIYVQRTTKNTLKTITNRLKLAEKCLEDANKEMDHINKSLKLFDEVGGTEGVLEQKTHKLHYLKNENAIEIFEEIADDFLEINTPPPLPTNNLSTPYIPSHHVETFDINTIHEEFDSMSIEKSKITQNSNSKSNHPKSLFKQRIQEYKAQNKS